MSTDEDRRSQWAEPGRAMGNYIKIDITVFFDVRLIADS
jgi:hypothetical protein